MPVVNHGNGFMSVKSSSVLQSFNLHMINILEPPRIFLRRVEHGSRRLYTQADNARRCSRPTKKTALSVFVGMCTGLSWEQYFFACGAVLVLTVLTLWVAWRKELSFTWNICCTPAKKIGKRVRFPAPPSHCGACTSQWTGFSPAADERAAYRIGEHKKSLGNDVRRKNDDTFSQRWRNSCIIP